MLFIIFNKPLIFDDIEYTVIVDTKCFNKDQVKNIAPALIPLRLIGSTDEQIINHFTEISAFEYSNQWVNDMRKELKKL